MDKLHYHKVRLRTWDSSDVERLTQLANNINIAKYLTNGFPHPYAESDAKKFIEMSNDQNMVRAILADEELVGGIGLHKQSDIHEKCAELGYWVGEPFWGKGIATRAIPLIVDEGFRDLGINRIYARTFSNNPGSSRVLEKVGFQYEGKLKAAVYKGNEFLDLNLFAILNPLFDYERSRD